MRSNGTQTRSRFCQPTEYFFSCRLSQALNDCLALQRALISQTTNHSTNCDQANCRCHPKCNNREHHRLARLSISLNAARSLHYLPSHFCSETKRPAPTANSYETFSLARSFLAVRVVVNFILRTSFTWAFVSAVEIVSAVPLAS